LIYTKETENAVRLDFDIAQPGKPEAFSSYIQSRTRTRLLLVLGLQHQQGNGVIAPALPRGEQDHAPRRRA
jgi:hypothetical protein